MSVMQAVGSQGNAINLRELVKEWEERIRLTPLNTQLYIQAAEMLDGAGFYQTAYSFLLKAQELNPSGAVIAEFRRRHYHSHSHGGEGCSVCDALCGLCVLDSCCECMGGDLCECC